MSSLKVYDPTDIFMKVESFKNDWHHKSRPANLNVSAFNIHLGCLHMFRKWFSATYSMKKNLILLMSNQRKKNILPPIDQQTVKIIDEFCDLTSLHGFSFLNKASNTVVKIIWIIAIFGMIGVGIVFLINNTDAYMKSRLETNIESSTANLSVSPNSN